MISSYPFYVLNGRQVVRSSHLELHAILLVLGSLTFKQIVGLYQHVVVYVNLQLFLCHSIQVPIYLQSDQQITQLKWSHVVLKIQRINSQKNQIPKIKIIKDHLLQLIHYSKFYFQLMMLEDGLIILVFKLMVVSYSFYHIVTILNYLILFKIKEK